jgi:hypothetical protein
MLWQQAISSGQQVKARAMAKHSVRELRQLDAEFREYWPLRNKGTTEKSSAFLRWRIEDYNRGRLHFSRENCAA